MMLVSLDTARNWVRLDSTDDDAILEAVIVSASDMIVNHLGADALERLAMVDSNGVIPVDSEDLVAVDVPGAVLQATRYLIAWIYRNRDADGDQAFERGYLPAPVAAALYPLRDPVLA
jgi:hypothetical protein